MKNTTVLKLSFALIICVFILLIINSRTSLFGTVGVQYSPTPKPTGDVTSTIVNTDRIVAQLDSYDNVTKQLKMTLYNIRVIDCTNINTGCSGFTINTETAEKKSMILTNDVLFKMNTGLNDECVFEYDIQYKRAGNIDDLLKSKCQYIGTFSFFELKYDGDDIIEFSEIYLYIPGFN